MIGEAKNYKRFLQSVGSGEFDKVEIKDNGIILRSSSLKTPDRGVPIRLEFDDNRNEVLSTRHYSPMGALWRLRAGSTYKIYTNIKLMKPLPENVHAQVVVIDGLTSVLGLLGTTITPGELIDFTVFAYDSMEIEPMCHAARLVFYVDTSDRVKSSRTKKTGISKDSKTESGESTDPVEAAESGDTLQS